MQSSSWQYDPMTSCPFRACSRPALLCLKYVKCLQIEALFGATTDYNHASRSRSSTDAGEVVAGLKRMAGMLSGIQRSLQYMQHESRLTAARIQFFKLSCSSLSPQSTPYRLVVLILLLCHLSIDPCPCHFCKIPTLGTSTICSSRVRDLPSHLASPSTFALQLC